MRSSFPSSSKRHSSTFSATSLKIAKFVPVPSYVAPRGEALPGQTCVILGFFLLIGARPHALRGGGGGRVPPHSFPHTCGSCESGRCGPAHGRRRPPRRNRGGRRAQTPRTGADLARESRV